MAWLSKIDVNEVKKQIAKLEVWQSNLRNEADFEKTSYDDYKFEYLMLCHILKLYSKNKFFIYTSDEFHNSKVKKKLYKNKTKKIFNGLNIRTLDHCIKGIDCCISIIELSDDWLSDQIHNIETLKVLFGFSGLFILSDEYIDKWQQEVSSWHQSFSIFLNYSFDEILITLSTKNNVYLLNYMPSWNRYHETIYLIGQTSDGNKELFNYFSNNYSALDINSNLLKIG